MTHRPQMHFVVESPFSSRDWQRFGIDTLNSYFDVTILDVSQITLPALAAAREVDRLTDERIHTFTQLEEVELFLTRSKAAVILLNIGVSEVRFQIHQIAHAKNVLTAEFQLGVIPSASTQLTSRADRLVHRIRQLPSLSDLPRALHARRNNRKWGSCRPDVFFRGGSKARGRHPSGGTTTIDVHSLDYEQMLGVALPDHQKDGHRIAYLDQNLGFHSDVPGLGLRQPVEPSNFYPRLNAFFRWLNQQHGLSVVICPHPRASKTQTAERFPGLIISSEMAWDEVARSGAVIGHYSTSLSFAVLAKTPVLLITSSELLRSWYSPYINSFAGELNAPLVNIDDQRTWIPPQTLLNHDQRDAYISYEQKFLRSYGGPVRNLWVMIGEALLQKVDG